MSDSESEYETDSGSEYGEEAEPEPVKAPAKAVKAAVKKDKAPCQVFRVDVTAETFGMCKCGWARADHVEKKVNKAQEALDRLRSSRMEPVSAGDPSGSHEFVLDMNADGFGVCKVCGKGRADHVTKGINPARAALKSLRKVNEAPATPVKVHSGKACGSFQLDMNASTFNTCVHCGKPRVEHVEKKEDVAAQMLANLKQKNQKAHEREDMLAAGMTVDDGNSEKAGNDKAGKGSSASASNAAAPPKAKGCCVVM